MFQVEIRVPRNIFHYYNYFESFFTFLFTNILLIWFIEVLKNMTLMIFRYGSLEVQVEC